MNKIKSDGSSSTHLIDKDWIQADQHFMVSIEPASVDL